MRLSAFTVVDSYPEYESGARDRYAEVLELADAAERNGLSALWVAEHHFHTGGVCPSPPTLLAAIGARTQRLRVGSLVAVLPFHSPVEIAEQYALVDRLVHGRLNLGVGSGYLPQEFEGFGVDPEEKRARFDRALEVLLRAWRGEAIPPVAGSGPPIRINVKPIQRPAPPIWVAAQRREALPHLARAGRSVALIPYATVDSIDELAQEIREFRAALPGGTTAEVAAAVHVYSGTELSVARQALQRYLDSRLATHSTHLAAKVRADPRRAHAEAVESSGFAAFGSPEEVARQLQNFAAAGVDELLGIFDFGALPVRQVVQSVASLGARWGR
ncbi:MAG: LLM class flavin-dependent oxidoreductase [Thermoplasmata archaeon]|nr:LLM class flavin-dependent oxidoreductase [Thermoplasmata archaeon]MCI4337682.1 LLM class flavin-dependent oxidoreductase [Thermoplasmata archaeon]MCI4341327.1 LLM class flavin-dependent oxidoreductase [Thermoplasmata archaeon]